jgi:hypothetical protein
MHLDDSILEILHVAFPDREDRRAAIKRRREDTRTVAPPEPLQSGSLCASCTHFTACMRPGKRAGVWHCEDYF